MKGICAGILSVILPVVLVFFLAGAPMIQRTAPSVDDQVRSFLGKMEHSWREMNVPRADGEILYDIVLDHKYTRALEIGTSTGLSGIYIAWALSKTGGKLITIEIDETRHSEAVENFREAGLGDIIDARLADAHELVAELSGPFDFVFIDADKDWYSNYAKAVIPKLEAGGCITSLKPAPGKTDGGRRAISRS
jgi:caffeoyl-CoA O-methyltransferase